MTQQKSTSTNSASDSSKSSTTIKPGVLSGIKSAIYSLIPVSRRCHIEELASRDSIIAALEKQAEVDRKRSDSLHQQSQQKIQENADEARYWKMRFQSGGSVGTPAAAIKEVVAGPYFCEPGTLANLRPQLTSLFAEKLGPDKLPNESQWEMILCENPLACVNAGAGSGKSTTLILRLYVMRKFLRIPWRHISVFTFTKHSKWDLIDKLIKTFDKLGENVDPIRAADIVRTFHSYACLLDKSSSTSDRQVFDLIGVPTTPDPRLSLNKSNESSSEVSADDLYDIENPLVEAIEDPTEEDDTQRITLNTKLKEIYHIAFENSEDFRDCIQELTLASHSLKPQNISPDYQAKVGFVEDKDEELTQFIHDRFGNTECFRDVLDVKIEKLPIDGTKNGLQCLFNARIRTTKQPILFMPSKHDREEARLPKCGYRVRDVLTAKLRMLWLESHVIPLAVDKDELVALATFLRYFRQNDFSSAPPFDFAPQGESLKKRGGHIASRFFQLIQFVENFGMDFQDWAAKLSLPPTARTDRIYVRACEIFYGHYVEYLNSNGYKSFNSLFLSVQPSKIDFVQRRDPKVLEKLTHVFIDEFQDITPLYSNFVKAIKFVLARRTGQAGSIMAVGDDYQSIYGWKGSLVKLITNFRQEFDSYHPPLPIKMEINHRCTQNIINFSESFIRLIPPELRTSKIGISAKSEEMTDPLPRVFFVKESDLVKQAAALIQTELEITKSTTEFPLLVMCRANKTARDIKAQLIPKDRSRTKIMTFHASKGLESRSTILIGDCYYDKRHLIKNDVLRQFNKSDTAAPSYDEMQKLEALRLAYVAATRAAVRCHWIFVDHPRASEVRSTIKASAERINPLCELIEA